MSTARTSAPAVAAARGTAKRSLWIVLGGGVLAWLLLQAGIFADIAAESGKSGEELWGPDAVAYVHPSTYLILAAVAVLAVASLIAKRTDASAVHGRSTLAHEVYIFAITVMIIALVLAAWGAIIVFVSNFLGGQGNDDVWVRILGSYLPIVLYTVLVVVVLLAGFVFGHGGRAANDPMVDQPAPAGEGLSAPDHAAAPAAAGYAQAVSPVSATTTDTVPAHPGRDAQRATALGYTLPIVAVMIAFIFGLIVYDITQTPLEAWIWVVVQVFVAAGIIAGTVFAARAMSGQRRRGERPVGVSVGAKNLNLVLSIVFAAVVVIMSVGYGASALEQLRVQPRLSLSVFTDWQTKDFKNLSPAAVTLSADGAGLERGSLATITLEPGGAEVASMPVERDGYLWINDVKLPDDLAEGEYELTLRASSVDGVSNEVAVALSVAEDGRVSLPNDPGATLDEQPSRLAAPTFGWVIGDFVPAAVLLALVVATLAITITARHREE